MDTNAPRPSLRTDIGTRSKQQVLMEDWGVLDRKGAKEVRDALNDAPYPPVETWTTLRLPYKAPNSPPLVPEEVLSSFSCYEYPEHMKRPKPKWERAAENSGTGYVYRFADYFFKWSNSSKIDEVATKQEPIDERLNENVGMNWVCRFGDYVVKWSGNGKIIDEAENLLFLAKHLPQMRVPTLLAAWKFRNEYGHMRYCHMTTYIDGVRLDGMDQFANMPIKAQDIICAKVSAQIAHLRSLPSDGWYYGRIHRQGWIEPPDTIELDVRAPKTVTAPYTTYEDFTAAIIKAYEIKKAVNSEGPEWYDGHVEELAKLASALKDWKPNEPKLTWLDPKFKNMVAVPIGGDVETATDWDVFLVDWEDFGWYPAWLQAMQVLNRSCAYVKTGVPFREIRVDSYREEEIRQMILKDFDPDYDLERHEMTPDTWSFY